MKEQDEEWIPKTKSKIYFEEKFKELYSDQIEGAEFEFLGLETRFKRNIRGFDFEN